MSKPTCNKERLERKEESTDHTSSVNATGNVVLNVSDVLNELPSPIPKSLSTDNNHQCEENITSFINPSSQDKLPVSGRKNKKKFKKEGSLDIISKLVVDSFLSHMKEDVQSDQKLYLIYPNPDELCDECRWLVKATKSSDSMKSSSEDEEFVTRWIESRKCLNNGKDNQALAGKQLTEFVEYSQVDVNRLLTEAHSALLECNILLTTQKLQREVRKSENVKQEDKVVSETSINEEWFEEIDEDGDPKDVASKLGFILERFVSKYLKCSMK